MDSVPGIREDECMSLSTLPSAPSDVAATGGGIAPEPTVPRRQAPPRPAERPDPVESSGVDSFPASDPPSWWAGT